MGCKTSAAGRIINEKCDCCEHSLHWHNILHDPDRPHVMSVMPEDGWPCLACDWEARLRQLEQQHDFRNALRPPH